MSFCVVKGDLLKQKYDALVIPSQPSLKLEGVIGSKVEEICGERLKFELDQMKKINISECVITNAYNLDCKRLIHVANPKRDGGNNDEEYNLYQSYLSCLYCAVDFKLKSIAFPLLSTGAYKFPKRRAIEIAIQTITDFIGDEDNKDLDVALVIYTENTFKNYKDLFKGHEIVPGHLTQLEKNEIRHIDEERGRFSWYRKKLEQIIAEGTDSKKFFERLNYYMSIYGLTKLDCYNGIISKSAFNNILNGAIPKKYTVVALGINMGLRVDEIDDLLVPLGEMLNIDFLVDKIIYYGIIQSKTVEEINQDLVAKGCVPLKTINLEK